MSGNPDHDLVWPDGDPIDVGGAPSYRDVVLSCRSRRTAPQAEAFMRWRVWIIDVRKMPPSNGWSTAPRAIHSYLEQLLRHSLHDQQEQSRTGGRSSR
jgi:hypothetical protein